MKSHDQVISVLLIGIAGLVFYGTKDYGSGGLAMIGADFWPRVLATLLIVLAIVLFTQSMMKSYKDKANPIDLHSPGMKRVVKMCLALAVFSVILYYFGFIISILFLIPICMVILGERRKKWLAMVTGSVIASVYIIFVLILQLRLPEGIFF